MEKFYDWLFQKYYEGIPVPRVEWTMWEGGLAWILIWGATLTFFFVIYAMYFRNQRHGAPGIDTHSTFAGIIAERHGHSLTPFTIYVFGVLIAWAVYFVVHNIVSGMVY